MIRTTVPKLPRGMERDKGCERCGERGGTISMRIIAGVVHWLCRSCNADPGVGR